MKLKRREMLVGGAVALSAAQQPASAQGTAAATPELVELARAAMRTNREAIRKVTLPIAVEPAFQFKA